MIPIPGINDPSYTHFFRLAKRAGSVIITAFDPLVIQQPTGEKLSVIAFHLTVVPMNRDTAIIELFSLWKRQDIFVRVNNDIGIAELTDLINAELTRRRQETIEVKVPEPPKVPAKQKREKKKKTKTVKKKKIEVIVPEVVEEVEVVEVLPEPEVKEVKISYPKEEEEPREDFATQVDKELKELQEELNIKIAAANPKMTQTQEYQRKIEEIRKKLAEVNSLAGTP